MPSQQPCFTKRPRLRMATRPLSLNLPEGLTETLDRRWEEIVSGRVECRDAFEALDELRAKHCV